MDFPSIFKYKFEPDLKVSKSASTSEPRNFPFLSFPFKLKLFTEKSESTPEILYSFKFRQISRPDARITKDPELSRYLPSNGPL